MYFSQILFHSNESNFLDRWMEIIEEKGETNKSTNVSPMFSYSGLRVSQCFKFVGWSLSYINLTVVNLVKKNLILVPRKEAVSQLLHQLLSTNCSVRMTRLDPRKIEKTVAVSGLPERGEEEVIEVVQNREMKRKGVRLGRGWRVVGVKTERELVSGGERHSFIKIDWQYRSPDGNIYNDLKSALKASKKNLPKFEKWEVLKDKDVKILEAAPAYVTLKQQLEDELDQALERDVFGVR